MSTISSQEIISIIKSEIENFDMHAGQEQETGSVIWVGAVSYTHLDVYKRQMVICGWAGKLMSNLGWMQSGSCPQEIRPIKKIIKSLRERCVSVWLNWPLQILPIFCIRILN